MMNGITKRIEISVVILVMIMFLLSCALVLRYQRLKAYKEKVAIVDTTINIPMRDDTVRNPSTTNLQNSIDTFYVPKFDTVYIDNCKPLVDSLKDELFIAKYKIERVKYYLKITQRNPSQTKFLKSWINRAVN